MVVRCVRSFLSVILFWKTRCPILFVKDLFLSIRLVRYITNTASCLLVFAVYSVIIIVCSLWWGMILFVQYAYSRSVDSLW